MKSKVRAIFSCIWLLFAYYTNAVEERCQFCNKIFKSLGRHSWRCKAKLHTYPLQVDRNHDNDIDFNILLKINQVQQPISMIKTRQNILRDLLLNTMNKCNESKTDNNEMQCHCGKLCKGDSGLRAHQRFCQISRTGARITF